MSISARLFCEVPGADSGPVPSKGDGVGETKQLGLLAQIREDWAAHGSDYKRPGFHAVAVHRLGAWQTGIRPKVLRAPLNLVYRTLNLLVRNLHGIELSSSAQLGRRVVLEPEGGIVVHGNSVIGDECVIRQNVRLGSRGADRPDEAPRLGNRVSIGAGAKILGDVSIGDDARIGADAVIFSNVRPGALAVGVPIRTRQH
jgi:serine O-acetyltransferase